MKSPFQFAQHGECGAWVSEIFPKLADHVDKIAFVYSCWTDSNNHSPALFRINTGNSRQGFPCTGAWVTYGLGSENQNLPAFLVMYDTLGRGIPKGHSQNWGAGFMPHLFQGTALKPQGDPIENLNRSSELTDSQQRAQLDLLRKLNRSHLNDHPEETDLAARIESFELAYRMQLSAPEAFDLGTESHRMTYVGPRASVERLPFRSHFGLSHFSRQALLLAYRSCVRSHTSCRSK